MGKILKTSIRADAVILESLRGRGRTGGGGSGMELKRKQAENREFNENKAAKRCSAGEDEDELTSNGGGGEALSDPTMNLNGQEEAGEDGEEQHENLASEKQGSDSNWIEEEEERKVPEEEAVRAANSRLLRASHSDSCLRSRARDPIGHSRSNSVSFSHEQSLGLALATTTPSGLQDAQQEQHFEHLREAEACYDDNTLVSCEESQPSTISRTKEDEEEQREAPTPGSTSRQLNYPSLVRDCGPGWRHRSGAPTDDELEDFFATVESEKDDRKRFTDKYNFDLLNDVPLPGRFEWESLTKQEQQL